MPQYLSPGVYVEEVKSSIQPIAGVGTSTAGFIGAAADGVVMPVIPGRFRTNQNGELVDAEGNALDPGEAPVPVRYTVAPAGQPQLVTSWESFKNLFGDSQAGNLTLAHAVYGFFNNGGTRCWITRVATLSADTAGDALDGFAAIDEIALVAVPGALDAATQQAVVDHCERLGDRFAILDGQRVTSPANWTAAAIKGTVNNSNYA